MGAGHTVVVDTWFEGHPGRTVSLVVVGRGNGRSPSTVATYQSLPKDRLPYKSDSYLLRSLSPSLTLSLPTHRPSFVSRTFPGLHRPQAVPVVPRPNAPLRSGSPHPPSPDSRRDSGGPTVHHTPSRAPQSDPRSEGRGVRAGVVGGADSSSLNSEPGDPVTIYGLSEVHPTPRRHPSTNRTPPGS